MKRVIILGFGVSQGLDLSYKALVLDDAATEEPQAVDRAVVLSLDDSADDIRNSIVSDATSFFEVSKHDLIFV